MTLLNREVYARDPKTVALLNNGVSTVAEVGRDAGQIKTLRFELENFVCDGEYAKGLERILNAYMKNLGAAEQQAVWVSGFFGSGKSHLVKMLRYLWEDYAFADGDTARTIVRLPNEISDLFRELTTKSKPLGGLRAAAGTLGAGSMGDVRLAFIQLVLRSAGLPEDVAHARFVLKLRADGHEERVREHLDRKGCDFLEEVTNMTYSIALAEAIIAAEPKYGSVENVQEALRTGYPEVTSPTIADALSFVKQVFGRKNTKGQYELPATLLVIDEIEQYIGQHIQRAMDLQEIAEHCCKDLGARLLMVGTGQSGLTQRNPSLQRLQARFTVRVQLSDTDVEGVIRKTVLRKKPEQEKAIRKALDSNEGEIARQLQETRFAVTHADDGILVAEYPLLPTRRRFWEKVLRNTDHSGTKAQLRSQLQVVFEATRATADKPVGSVVSADFIYDQVSTDLLNSGELENAYDLIIRKQRDGSEDGELRSSIAALIFLIGKLPRTPGIDDGVRATPETLVDLLVCDLKNDRAKLEPRVTKALKQLVDAGEVMAVDSEYRLQTREGAQWTSEFNRRRNDVLRDESRINSERAELLRQAMRQALKNLRPQQGRSKEPRRFNMELSSTRPAPSRDEITVWMRDGWNDDEKSVLNDARAAGINSPMIFGYIPRLPEIHEPLRQAIASAIAARETLEAHGPGQTAEAIEARGAVDTHLKVAEKGIQDLLGKIIGSARVFLGGGQEANGVELVDRVEDATTSAMTRLFPQFDDADHPNWGQVKNHARAGDVGALGQVGWPGEVTKHAVCRQILDFIGAGKKGKDVRENFGSAPFGWPQDAIDGALYILLVAGNVRASLNHQATDAKALPQNQVGVATFHVDVPPLNVQQRLDLKALFQKLGITTASGKESEAASDFLSKLLALAESAGGPAPRPAAPETQTIRDLQMLSGNQQLLRIHELRAALTDNVVSWKKTADSIAKRLTPWQQLAELHGFAKELPEGTVAAASIEAIVANRGLLAEPDPIPHLAQDLTTALRAVLGKLQDDLLSAFRAGGAKLAAAAAWKRLSDEQRAALTANYQLNAPAKESFASDADILGALRLRNLADRRNLVDAVPQRFAQALEEAMKLLEPKAQRVTLPGATIRNGEELEEWIRSARDLISESLKSGPVIL